MRSTRLDQTGQYNSGGKLDHIIHRPIYKTSCTGRCTVYHAYSLVSQVKELSVSKSSAVPGQSLHKQRSPCPRTINTPPQHNIRRNPKPSIAHITSGTTDKKTAPMRYGG